MARSCLALVALCCTVLAAVPALGADSAGWKPFGLQAKEIRSLSMAANILCAGTKADGVFCLDLGNAGASWQPRGLAGAPVTGLWLSPSSAGVMFAASSTAAGRIFRSLDAGASWQRADTGVNSGIHGLEGVAGQSTLYAIGEGIWRSDDNGETWTRVWTASVGKSLRVPATDPNTVWAGGETYIFSGYTLLSRNRGATWTYVWDSWSGPGEQGDNQTADIATHPLMDGLALTGHEGFVLRTTNRGTQFQEVLTAPARFYLAWDRANTQRTVAAGSPNSGGWYSFASEDLGLTWTSLPAPAGAIYVFDTESDTSRLGVMYAATENGVYRLYGGGDPLCIDARAGIGDIDVRPGPCAPGSGALSGDIIVGSVGALAGTGSIDLGEVECLVDSGDITPAEITPPAPAPGRALFILARLEQTSDYGPSSGGMPRRPARGDCVP